jgi:hypothetical protein
VSEGEKYFKGVEFSTNLIVLHFKCIDVILGMDWLSKQNALIDYAKKSVKLTAEVGQDIEYVAEPLITHKGATNQIKLNQLEVAQSQDMRVVNENPDVFPEELPGMPSDHNIEFIIELRPGTAPIYKRPYRMSTPQLRKIKD